MSESDDDKTTLTPGGEEPSSDEVTLSVDRDGEDEYVGRRVAHYSLRRELGRGGQGAVYLARDERLKRPVALKLLSTQLGYSEQARLRFRREAEVASRLDHPGICTVYDAGEFEGMPYIAMRWIDGSPLDVLIKRARSSDHDALSQLSMVGAEPSRIGSDIAGKLAFFEKVLHALQAAHDAGLVHRDVKPGNIMVTHDGDPVVLDFGLARIDEPDGPDLTVSSDHVGTPAYMSPEQIGGAAHAVDARSDVYSAAVALFELLTLRRPHEAPTREALYRSILMSDPADPRGFEPRIPDDLAVVLDRALEKSPDRRYSTARALAADLRAVLEDRPVSVKPISTFGRTLRWARRQPGVAALLAFSVVAMTSIVGLGLYTLGRSELVDRGRLETAQENAERELEAAFLLQDAGNFEEAVTRFRRAAIDGRPLPEALAADCILHLGQDRLDAAVAILDARRDVVADVPMLAGLRTFAVARAGGMTEREALDSIALPEPRTAVEFLILALAEESRGERGDGDAWERASRHMVQAILRSERTQPRHHFLLAKCAGHAGDAGLVTHVGKALVGRWPANPAAAYWAGYGHDAAGMADEALRYFELALELDPDFARAHAGIARVRLRQRRTAEAREHLRLAMRDPSDVASRLAMLELLMTENRLEEALRIGRELVATAPRDDDAWSLIALAHWRGGEKDAAIAAQERAVSIDPDYAPYLLGLAEMLLAHGRRAEALEHARRVVAFAPEAVLARLADLVDAGFFSFAAIILDEIHAARPEVDDEETFDTLTLVELHLRAGLGEDRDAVDDADRARHRAKARARCGELLDGWERQLENGGTAVVDVRAAVLRVLESPLFETLDDEEVLGTFDGDERAEWAALAERFEELADRVE